ncbi:hypothetical protein PENTCL1PPCAC_13279 [Pristionchus entomophagus]|uniref:CUB domain-containing protein n=1 Tax=Pristionchus entomophagus TaxID=358040 RepID=A0AAV5TE42_9BILA|nr:hypothetical protein PENTCL1PPCAC_13279 [Pristionchus entomophagus]
MRGPLLSLILLFSLAHSSPCPQGWTQEDPKGWQQAPNGGDCFQVMPFWNMFIPDYYPKTFDEAEATCNALGGGLLASIHSQEEQDFIMGMDCRNPGGSKNIGLKCWGKDCKWDDGSPVTYTNFGRGKGPKDDGVKRCYGTYPWNEMVWEEGNCGQEKACWVCRVKAKTIDCVDGETEYKGGCVSVHLSPLDQKSAEASCPGDGHLVSIHSNDEKNYYTKLAVNAGANGTIYIGAQYSDKGLEFTDGSYYLGGWWANGFPNTLFGSCVQMLLASEFGNQGQWTNIDCTVKQPYICFRDGTVYVPPTTPPHPKADPKCPPIQYYSLMGNIYSPNYPLSIPGQQNCEYVIATLEGTRASVKFLSYDCQAGTSISLIDGLNGEQPFITFTSNPPPLDQYYTSTSNVLKIVFSTNGTSPPVGTGWEAEFTGI